jgi:hypothetical protein
MMELETLQKLENFHVTVGYVYTMYLKWYYSYYIRLDPEEFEVELTGDPVAVTWQLIGSTIFEYSNKHNIKTITDYRHIYYTWRSIMSNNTNDNRMCRNIKRFYNNL